MAKKRVRSRFNSGEDDRQDASEISETYAVESSNVSETLEVPQPVATQTTPNQVGSTKKTPKGAALEWLLMIVLVAYATWLVHFYQMGQLPAPLAIDDAGKRGFSEEAALNHVRSFVGVGPHPVGSEALDYAVQHVLSELYDIKDRTNAYVDVDIDLFHPSPGLLRMDGGLFKGKSLVYTNLKYPVVRLSPADFPDSKENAILVSSHIDSVFSTAGAGDCSSCVAVMLELVRALSHWAHGFKHSVIFVFNTGEEEGLIGSHSFITQHPWRSTIRTAIDLEAMGAGGKYNLFQAGPDMWLLELYAKVARYPSAQIIAQDIFQKGLIKSATDFQVYREIGGLSGLDFAYIENGAVYHTRNDKIEYLRPGSLQHLGDDMLVLLQEVAMSNQLPFVNKTSSIGSGMGMVYFDLLGNWMITYPQEFARNLHVSIISQGLILLLSSVYLSGLPAFGTFFFALVSVILAWIFSFGYVVVVAFVITYLSPFPVPYIAHPWLVVGLFFSPALFGAILGHTLGRTILMSHLHSLERKKVTKGDSQTFSKLIEWEAERWLFKAGIFQWILVLALGTWAEAGASYIALFWVIPPAIAYGFNEAQFSPKQSLQELRRLTLWISIAPGVLASATPLLQLTATLIGNLVRIDRNPGGMPEWLGNVVVGGFIACATCLMFVYLLPYAHRSGGVLWILIGLAGICFMSLALVFFRVVPAFTEHVGRAINVVHVIDTTNQAGIQPSNTSYISLSAVTPGKFAQEMLYLKNEGFTCGQTQRPDFVSFRVKYGCEKLVKDEETLLLNRPVLDIENDVFLEGHRSTTVILSTGVSHRWNLAINTSAVQAFKLEAISPQEVLVPGGDIIGVEDWHNIQFVTNQEGPTKFKLTLVWHSNMTTKFTPSGSGDTNVVVKLRTDVSEVTPLLARVLRKLPNWCVQFGKSTSPYTLAYLAHLRLQ